MTDRNFNQGNQSHQSSQDWDRKRNRSYQENEWSPQRFGKADYGNRQNRGMNQGGYRDAGYGGESAYGEGNQEGYRRTSYIPGNDESRSFSERNYEITKYGTSGTYDYGDERTGNQYRDDWDRRQRQQGRGGLQNRSYGEVYGGNVERREQETNRAQSDMQRQYNDMRRRVGYDRDANAGGYGMMSDEGGYGNLEGSQPDWRHQTIGAYSSDYGRNDYDRAYGRGNRDYNYGDEYGRDYVPSGGYGYVSDDYNRSREYKSNRGGAYQGSSEYLGQRNRDYGVSHRGKGPRGYHRSENRIQEDVCDRLTDDVHIDASDIRVQVDKDTVILSGTVRNREEKRHAEDLAESIYGVHDVENRLHVGHRGDMASHDYTGNTDLTGGIGTESGTMNEVIRNTSAERGKNKKV